jgi:hypothetical protein
MALSLNNYDKTQTLKHQLKWFFNKNITLNSKNDYNRNFNFN